MAGPERAGWAPAGELRLELSGQVKGSAYGQATVSSDAVRLVVGGEAIAPFGYAGQANVPEGEAYAFPATWLVYEGDTGLALRFVDSGEVVASVPLLVGEAGIAAAFLEPAAPSEPPGSIAPASPMPDAASMASASSTPTNGPTPASTSAPAGSPIPAVPSPAPTVAATPTPRPVTAAIATLLIYSGVPDPDWSLTQDDLDALAEIAARLTPIDGLPPEGDLGYRGLRVTGPQGTWRINDGVVMTPDTAPDASLVDPDRLVERYLLASGVTREALTEEEAAIVDDDLGPAPSRPPG